MVTRRVFTGTLGVFSLALAFDIGTSLAAPSPIAALDKDHDGTLDLAEVKDAAGAVFDKLEKDHDSTLDRREVGGRVATGEFKEADPDNDATLTKDEYLALVEKLFNEADADKNGTLSAANWLGLGRWRRQTANNSRNRFSRAIIPPHIV